MIPLMRLGLIFSLGLMLIFAEQSARAVQEPKAAAPPEARGEAVYNVVEGRTTIISLKPHGARVKKGDLVCELESFAARERLAKQELATRVAEAPYQYAKRTREIAELGIVEYIESDFKPKLRVVESEINLAAAELKRSEQTLASMKSLMQKGLAARGQVTAAELRVQQSKRTLETAQGKKTTLEKYTKEKKVKQLQSQVERAKAEELARQAEFGREQSALEQRKKQVEHCKLLAPVSGRVVYEEGVEEGAEVTQGQVVFRVVPEGETGSGAK